MDERRQKHVVMVVANEVSNDSRVQKTALAASEAGYRVTVVGLSKKAKREVEILGEAEIVRVPVPFTRYHAARGTNGPVAKLRRVARLLKKHGKSRLKKKRARVAKAQQSVALLAGVGAGRIQVTLQRFRLAVLAALMKLDQLGILGADRALRWCERYAAPKPTDQAAEERLFRAKLADFEQAFLAELAETEFDLIHAHDFSMVACASEAVRNAARTRQRPAFVYDAHEWVRGLTHLPAATQAVSVAVEEQHIRSADAVVTVSPVLAERLQQEHGLTERPALVLNAPLAGAYDPESSLSVRSQAGVGPEVPLAVYGGAVKASRGVSTIIRALPLLPDLHLAIVAQDANAAGVKEVLAEAVQQHCADRVHVVPYVRQDQVSNYLRTATLGVHPLLRSGNAELALPNKVFEYFHAGLPMVVSDMPSMAELVRGHGWGEVFTAGDPASLADALRRVLGQPEAYHAGLVDADVRRRFAWEHQAETLIAIYDRLLFDGADTGNAEALSGRPASA